MRSILSFSTNRYRSVLAFWVLASVPILSILLITGCNSWLMSTVSSPCDKLLLIWLKVVAYCSTLCNRPFIEVSVLFIDRNNESRECIRLRSVSLREPSLFLFDTCEKAGELNKKTVKKSSSEYLDNLFIGINSIQENVRQIYKYALSCYKLFIKLSTPN